MTPTFYIQRKRLPATTSQPLLSSPDQDLSAETCPELVTSMIYRILGGRTALDLVHNP